MKLFFHSSPEETPELSEEESLHALKVLRLKESDTIHLIDGKGNLFEGIITQTKAKKCNFAIQKKEFFPKNWYYYLHIAIAPTKNMDRLEWFIEKAIEIGIDEISLLECEHSERRNVNMERIEKIAHSAIKQSMNLYAPKINSILACKKFLSLPSANTKFIAHLEEGERRLLKTEALSAINATVLIGPEGDFSKEEISLALQNNFIPVSLGPNRLRTETAGLAACFTFSTLHL